MPPSCRCSCTELLLLLACPPLFTGVLQQGDAVRRRRGWVVPQELLAVRCRLQGPAGNSKGVDGCEWVWTG